MNLNHLSEEQIINAITGLNLVIRSKEKGTEGPVDVIPYKGKMTLRAIRAKLTRERCHGDREAELCDMYTGQYGETMYVAIKL
jgi:hypothetical protein